VRRWRAAACALARAPSRLRRLPRRVAGAYAPLTRQGGVGDGTARPREPIAVCRDSNLLAWVAAPVEMPVAHTTSATWVRSALRLDSLRGRCVRSQAATFHYAPQGG
jgi:hypothetical protein